MFYLEPFIISKALLLEFRWDERTSTCNTKCLGTRDNKNACEMAGEIEINGIRYFVRNPRNRIVSLGPV